MYENPSLRRPGTHHDLHRAAVEHGDVPPLIIGEVNLDEATTVTGIPLGFVVNPDRRWRRVRWSDCLARNGGSLDQRHDFPPCDRWFPPGSWPAAMQPPPEGSLDQVSLAAVLQVLAGASPCGEAQDCFVFYGSLPAGDFDTVTLWQGPLSA
jgi:hypothetical protein